MVSLSFDEISKMYNEIRFLKVDISELLTVLKLEEVCAVPCFYTYVNGKFKDQYIGSTKTRVVNLIEECLQSS